MRLSFVCIVLGTFFAATVQAEDEFDPAARAKVIAPFIDEQTLGVIHVDLARVQVDPLFEQLGKILPLAKEDFAKNRAEAREAQAKVVRAGVKDVYGVITQTRLYRSLPSFVVIPLPPGSDEQAIRATFPGNSKSERVGDVLVSGPDVPESRAQLRGMAPDPRPELVSAFEAAGDTAVQLLFLPPKYFRRVIDETMPELPKEFGGGSSKVLTRGVQWAAMGIDLPPHLAVHAIVKSEDGQAAEAFRVKLVELMRLAVQIKQVRPYVPKPEESIAILTPKVEGDRLVLSLDETNQGITRAVVAVLMPPVDVLRARAGRSQSTHNLMQLALAMHNYYDKYKQFPLPGSLGPDKKPLLSWRVHILPFVDEQKLYVQFHLNEPWDSPHNQTLIDKMPSIYRHPVSKRGSGRTNYALPVGNGAGFAAETPTRIRDIPDGTSNTLMIVEVDDEHAVIWTKPEDWMFDPRDPIKGLGQFFEGGFNTALFDGSVRCISPTIAPDTLRLLFTRADRRPIPDF